MWRHLINTMQALNPLPHLVPATCLLCSQPLTNNTGLCRECHQLLPTLTRCAPLCRCCAIPLQTTASHCGHCLTDPPAFSHSCIAFSYVHPLDFLIHQFKYRRQLSSGKLLASLLASYCQAAERPDFLVPVPMHWRKRWQRGFNQSELLAYPLGKTLNLPVLNALRREQHGHSQKGLSRSERYKNLRRAFSIKANMRPRLKDAHIALVDDVVTTTSTARCLSELLIKAGARRVDIWALARTPDH